MAEQRSTATTTSYGITRSHVRFEGILFMPTAGGPPEIVRVHQPYEIETVTWTGTRIGAVPDMPDPTQFAGTNMVFVGGHRIGAVPPLTEMSGHEYQMSGNYYYVRKDTIGLNSEMALGIMPYETGSPTVNNIPAGAFKTGILAPPIQGVPFQNIIQGSGS